MQQKIDVEAAMEKEILDEVQRAVNRFSPDYDYRNLTERQNEILKTAILDSARQQGELIGKLATIASTLHRLAAGLN